VATFVQAQEGHLINLDAVCQIVQADKRIICEFTGGGNSVFLAGNEEQCRKALKTLNDLLVTKNHAIRVKHFVEKGDL
jgi:hypothetical protein